MSLKLKQLLPIFVLALGIGLALLIPRVKAFAQDATDAVSASEIQDNNFTIRSYNISTYADISYVDMFEQNGVFYSTIGSTSDIYLNVDVTTRTPLQGYYINGRLLWNNNFTVSVGVPSGFTLNNLKYNVSLVSFSDDEHIDIGFHHGTNSGTYQSSVAFYDFGVFNSSHYFTLTLCIRITALAQWSGSQYSRPSSLPITISNTLSGMNDSIVSSSVSYSELGIQHAIDRSTNIQEIVDQLITVNAHMVWSDGVAVYDVADLLWMINGSLMTANSTLQSQYNQDTATQGIINQILSALTTDTSGISQSANDEIDDAHELEEDAQIQLIGLIESIDRGSYPGIGRTPSFDDGLASISNGINGAKDLLQNNSNSINFWKVVGDTILNSNQFGMIATFLCIVLILGFTVWILRL